MDINEAIKSFNGCLKQNPEYMKKGKHMLTDQRRLMKSVGLLEKQTKTNKKTKLLRKFCKSFVNHVESVMLEDSIQKLLQQKKKKFNENVLKISCSQDWFNHFQKMITMIKSLMMILKLVKMMSIITDLLHEKKFC